MASDELGTTDGFESGAVDCPQFGDYDWSVDIFEEGVPANVDCDVPFSAIGPVVMIADDMLGIADCIDCNCGTPRAQYEFHAQGLLPANHFTIGDCASVLIEWAPDADCRPIGFVVRSGDADAGRVHVVAGQDVETLPMTVGGAPIAVTPAETCECPECCPDSGTLALGFAGTSIVEGASADVDELLDNTDSFFVQVYEAHAHEDCSRSLGVGRDPEPVTSAQSTKGPRCRMGLPCGRPRRYAKRVPASACTSSLPGPSTSASPRAACSSPSEERAGDHVDERVLIAFDLASEAARGEQLDVEILDICVQPDRGRCTHDRANPLAVALVDGHLASIDAVVLGRHGLERARQVHPELQTAIVRAVAGHLRVARTGPGVEPLGAARRDRRAVAHRVRVLELPFEHVRERFEAAMRVLGETGRHCDVEVVEQHERIEIAQRLAREDAQHPSTGTVDRRGCTDALADDAGVVLASRGRGSLAATAHDERHDPTKNSAPREHQQPSQAQASSSLGIAFTSLPPQSTMESLVPHMKSVSLQTPAPSWHSSKHVPPPQTIRASRHALVASHST